MTPTKCLSTNSWNLEMFTSVGQKGIFCSGWGSSDEVTAGLSRGPISVTTGAFIQRLTRGLEGDVVVVETEMPSCCL